MEEQEEEVVVIFKMKGGMRNLKFNVTIAISLVLFLGECCLNDMKEKANLVNEEWC